MASIRTVDRAARIGGEEIALILIQTERSSATEVASRAIAALAKAPIAIGEGLTVSVTASAGVAEMPSDGANSLELFAAADKALYLAKAAGRNRVVPAGAAPAAP